jgi:3-carboxy-cis,cis-muconate cycloisomerase
MHTGMFESFITQHWFSDEAKHIWSDHNTLHTWLRVEAALAKAQAQLGMIPQDAACIIAEKADAKHFDFAQLSSGIAFAQHPLVPVLHQFEKLCGEPAAGYIHWGATTQNIFDSACAVQMHQTHGLIIAHLNAAINTLGELALAHQSTVMPGRTHGQHALPMTMGFKIAGWVDELDRNRTRLEQRVNTSFVASIGGAIGTFAAMGHDGREVEKLMAQHLGLQPAGLSLRSSYDRVNDYVSALGLLSGTIQKIAQDMVFMQRTEVAEGAEAFHMGKVGSSTMAQKRNPSTALLLISLARMLRARIPTSLEAMVRMDEGDSSSTNVTDTLLPEIAVIATSTVETLDRLSQGFVVFPEAMQRNLDMTHGLIASEAAMMRLTAYMGRHEAHKLLYEAAQRSQTESIPFLTAIQQHPAFANKPLPADIEEALLPSAYVGDSVHFAQETVQRTKRK